MRKTILTKIFLAFIFISLASSCTVATKTGNDSRPEVTLLPSQTSGTQADTTIENKCLDSTNVETFPENKGSIGTFNPETNRVSLWDLETHQKLPLGQVEILTGAFSTTQQLAYIDTELQKVVIVSGEGKKLASISAPKGWKEILGWADPENLIISNMPFRNDGGWSPPSSTIILNITNGKYKEFYPEYPNIYPYTSGPPNFGRYSYSITAYDPTLTRVVYPAVSKNSFFVSLWDVSSNHELTRLYLPDPYNPPQWKQDGLSFILSAPPVYKDSVGNIQPNTSDTLKYVGGNELYRISKNGSMQRLTYLTTRYVASESAYAWSPSGKLIAFWLRIEGHNGWQLAVLNAETGLITNYCIGGGDGSFPIIWSPDNSQIISTIVDKNSNASELILINILKDLAYTIDKDEIALGWINKE